MAGEQVVSQKPTPVDEQVLRDAGQYLRGWAGGIRRGLPAVIPLVTAIGGATLFYCAKVSEDSYLRQFGIHVDQFGGKSPDIAKIVFPALLVALWMGRIAYKGFTRADKGNRFLEAGFNRVFLRGDGRTIAARIVMFFGIVPALMLFSLVHWSSVWYGRYKAYSVIYRVANRGCAEDCLFYQKGVFGPKRIATGELGIPVVSGDGRIAIFTGRGVAIVKLDDVQLISSGRLPNAKKTQVSVFNDYLFGYIIN